DKVARVAPLEQIFELGAAQRTFSVVALVELRLDFVAQETSCVAATASSRLPEKAYLFHLIATLLDTRGGRRRRAFGRRSASAVAQPRGRLGAAADRFAAHGVSRTKRTGAAIDGSRRDRRRRNNGAG